MRIKGLPVAQINAPIELARGGRSLANTHALDPASFFLSYLAEKQAEVDNLRQDRKRETLALAVEALARLAINFYDMTQLREP